MNLRPLPTLLVLATVAFLAAVAGWIAARRLHLPLPAPSPNGAEASASRSGERKILFYQSAMHPWIRSDKPGKCTLCGMALTPVFEGDSAAPLDPGLVALGSNAISVLHVRSAPVRQGPLLRTLRVAGTFEDDDTRHRVIAAWTAGRIDELFVNYVGAEVTAGQPLARFYSPGLLEAERQYVAVLGSASSPATQADHELLRDAAILRLRQLGLTDSQIERLPSKSPTNAFSEILAPIGGTIIDRSVYAGQYVTEGEKLFEIADFSTLWFLFDAYEQDLPWLQPGQELEISSPAAPGKVFRAPIRFIDPNLTGKTRSAKVRVEVSNPVIADTPSPRRALSRLSYAEGSVRITVPDVLLLPRSSVLSPARNPVVYVDHGNGVYQRKPVRLGRFGDDDYEVVDGLQPGERVVIQGNLLIDAQAQINETLAAAEEIPPQAPRGDSPPASSSPQVPDLSATSGETTTAIRAFLVAADSLRSALASDDLPAFHRASEALAPRLLALRTTLSAHPNGSALVDILPDSTPNTASADLRVARRDYHAFSTPLVTLARALRSRSDEFKDLKVFRCPMTAESFDGAPPRAEWIQWSAGIRNPWFGAEMIECGVEVRD
ncbi:MAG: efflux RND transporter periplasmic adaptor subunit [Limisphaerales bacterium]